MPWLDTLIQRIEEIINTISPFALFGLIGGIIVISILLLLALFLVKYKKRPIIEIIAEGFIEVAGIIVERFTVNTSKTIVKALPWILLIFIALTWIFGAFIAPDKPSIPSISNPEDYVGWFTDSIEAGFKYLFLDPAASVIDKLKFW